MSGKPGERIRTVAAKLGLKKAKPYAGSLGVGLGAVAAVCSGLGVSSVAVPAAAGFGLVRGYEIFNGRTDQRKVLSLLLQALCKDAAGDRVRATILLARQGKMVPYLRWPDAKMDKRRSFSSGVAWDLAFKVNDLAASAPARGLIPTTALASTKLMQLWHCQYANMSPLDAAKLSETMCGVHAIECIKIVGPKTDTVQGVLAVDILDRMLMTRRREIMRTAATLTVVAGRLLDDLDP